MTEYAACPGGCGHPVKIWPGDQLPMCCHPCFQTWWSRVNPASEGPVDHGHSEQCDDRRATRVGVPLVTDRQFMLAGRPPNGPKNT